MRTDDAVYRFRPFVTTKGNLSLTVRAAPPPHAEVERVTVSDATFAFEGGRRPWPGTSSRRRG